jgi:F-type H+-transporting ATPase subunit beta
MSGNTGKITQVIGPVVDVSFDTEKGALPNILDSLEIKREDGQKVVLECQQHVGEDTVRAIAMDATDGLRRGMEVVSTGSPITLPIGEEIRGRLFNVVGDAIDGIGEVSKEGGYPIHREPPKFEEFLTQKVVRLDYSVVQVLVKQY